MLTPMCWRQCLLAALAVLVVPVMANGRPAPLPASGQSTPAERGLAFATAHCASCHAIGRPAISPDPEAPPFETIVTTPGLTSATLADWLRDSHNYPEAMQFTIAPDQVADLAAYMLTLRS